MKHAIDTLNDAADLADAKRLNTEMQRALRALGWQLSRPSAIRKPKVYKDGNAWCALEGEDIQIGVCGFGDTPDAACAAFDLAWLNERPNAQSTPK